VILLSVSDFFFYQSIIRPLLFEEAVQLGKHLTTLIISLLGSMTIPPNIYLDGPTPTYRVLVHGTYVTLQLVRFSSAFRKEKGILLSISSHVPGYTHVVD
jgi:hypothetical protein